MADVCGGSGCTVGDGIVAIAAALGGFAIVGFAYVIGKWW